MKEFDFDGDNKNNLSTADDLPNPHQQAPHGPPHSAAINQSRNSGGPPLYGATAGTPVAVNQGMPPELRPAAQTLKQMAEQHQHKTQLGLNYPGHTRNPNQTSQSATPPQPPTPNIKQEIVYSPGGNPGTPQGSTRLTGGYSPYGSPSGNSNNVSNGNTSNSAAGSNNVPRSQQQTPQQKPQPPRPPSGPGIPNHPQATLQINQAQQLHISQSQGQPIQVSMAQNLQTDMKPSSLSVAAHQGLYFTQQNTGPTDSSYCAVSQSQTINFTQQTLRQRAAAARQHAQHPPQHRHTHPHHQQGLPVLRPPPEYQNAGVGSNSSTGIQAQQSSMIHSMLGQQPHRFPSIPTQAQQQAAAQQRAVAAARMAQQTMPPSGPMMRPQQGTTGVYMTSSSAAAAAAMLQHQHQQQQQQQQQRLSAAAFGNPNMPRQALRPQGPPVIHIPSSQTGSSNLDNNEWRQHLMMSHASHQNRTNSGFLHQAQGVLFGTGNLQIAAGQVQQQQVLSSNPTRLMTPPSQQQSQPHQTMSLQQTTPQMSLNLHMSQQMGQFSRQHCASSGMNYNNATGGGNTSNIIPNNCNGNTNSLSCYNTSTGGVNTSTSNNSNNSVSCSNSNVNAGIYQTANNLVNSTPNSYTSPHLPSDLNLDFLEQLPNAPMDSSQMAQDILSSFDAGASFNLNDIL